MSCSETANLVFWQLFIAADMLTVGYVTTALHGLFAAPPAACRQHRGNLDNRSYPSLNEIISHLFQI